MARWAELTDDGRVDWADWVVDTCLQFGTTRGTAYRVAAAFCDGLDADLGTTVAPEQIDG